MHIHIGGESLHMDMATQGFMLHIYIYMYIYIQGFGYRDIWGVVHIGWRDKNNSTTFSCRAVI